MAGLPGVVLTVCGALPAEKLGHCQPHEHVYIADTPALLNHPELRVCILPLSIEEHCRYRQMGGGSVVDVQTLGAGRNALALEQVARQSGIAIVGSTGFHVPWLYGEGLWMFSLSEEKLCALFQSEIREGMFLDGCYEPPRFRTDIRAGAVKAALHPGYDTDTQRRLLRAAGRAAACEGVPLILHTEAGDGAEDAVMLLKEEGLSPRKILVCHTDWKTDNFLAQEGIARLGVLLDFDAVNLFEFHDTASEIRMVLHMLERGYGDSLTLATDPNLPRIRSYGGKVGIDHILTDFLPKLRVAGVSEADIRRMTVENPARLLAMHEYSILGGHYETANCIG